MNQYQSIQVPPIAKATKIMIIVLVVSFLINSLLVQLAAFSVSGLVGVSGVNTLSGYLWTFVTYPWLPHDLLSLVFNALILWFLGSELEFYWGTRQYVFFFFITAILSAILYLVVVFVFFRSQMIFAFPLTGIHGLCSALCVIYGLRFPDRTMLLFFFPVQAKWFVSILVAMNLYQGFFSPSGATAWNQLFAMAIGALWIRYDGGALIKKGFRTKKTKKSHLKVVKDDDITYH